MRRRQLLALSGSLLAGSAGCLSASAPEASGPTATQSSPTTDSDPTTEPTPDSTTDATTTAESADVSVALDALQPALVTSTSPDSIGVSGRDQRYLLVEVSTDGSGRPPAPEAFSFEVGDAAVRPEPMDQPWRVWRFYSNEEALYDRDSGEGLLLFEFPEDAGSDADSGSDTDAGPVLTWPGGEWRPDESLRRRLAAPEPPLSVSVDVPAEIEPGESPTVSVTVENGGDVPGRFVAGLNRIGPRVAYAPVERVSLLVPAGGSETWEHDSSVTGGYPDEKVGDDQVDVTYHLDWVDGDVRRDVRYVE